MPEEPTVPDARGLPRHPELAEDPSEPQETPGAGVVLVVLLGALMVVIVVLHLTGVVGSGAH